MMSDPDPTLDDVPLESAVQAEAEAAEPEVTETRPPRPPLDDRTQLAVGAGLAVAIIGLLGSFFGAWELIFGGLILITAGLVAAGAAYVSSGREAAPSTVATRDLILAGGTIAAVFGILYSAEIVFALDIVDSFGGVLGLTLTFGLAIAGVLLYFAATLWWTGGPAAPWTERPCSGRPSDQARAQRHRGLPARLARQRHHRDLVPAGRGRGHHVHPAGGARDARGGGPR